jgi:hypothetical protein
MRQHDLHAQQADDYLRLSGESLRTDEAIHTAILGVGHALRALHELHTPWWQRLLRRPASRFPLPEQLPYDAVDLAEELRRSS